jgi:phenylacetate-coenzyme A ligase PaaK-like adenylate-forming protein
LFRTLKIEPRRLSADEIPLIPPTDKETLRADPDSFVARTAQPCMRALTTGTTGRFTSIHFSDYEVRTIVALSAIGYAMNGQMGPRDIVQIGTSSRAALGNLGLSGASARLGAIAYTAGMIGAGPALELLSEPRRLAGKKPRTSILSAYPSYLGQLVQYGLSNGYRPRDFGLERIFTGGELVTRGLKRRCADLFGPVQFIETYAMTETIPFGATLCSQDHLHFEPSHGLLEVLEIESGKPAAQGAAGTLVATPFMPYRDTTLLLRYDTQDVVRPIAGTMSCEMRWQPATSQLLGKLALAVRHDGGWCFPRDVLEAVETIDAVPLPGRCSLYSMAGGVALEVFAPGCGAAGRGRIADALEERGIPLRRLTLLENPALLRRPLPIRCDLTETCFGAAADPQVGFDAGPEDRPKARLA